MASISNSPPPPSLLIHKNPTSNSSSSSLHFSSPSILSFPSYRTPLVPRLRPLIRTGFDGGRVACQDAQSPDLLKKPVVSSSSSSSSKEGNRLRKDKGSSSDGEEEEWVDWEDLILEDTVPLVGFVRMILHSGKYQSGERLSPDHEKTLLERLLPYHPEYEQKVGSGIDYITIGYHPDFDSRCLFIVKNDGKSIDFSYWKCIKGLIKKKYPLYADSFILKHFRQQRNLVD